MAINQVRVQVNGVWHTLTYNSSTGKYEKAITAPNVTSYNVNAGHYYPVTVEATNTAGTKTTVNDQNAGIGISLSSLVLKIDGGTAIGSGSTGMVCNPVTNGYDCTYTPPSALSDGAHTVTINVSDYDGNAARSEDGVYAVSVTAYNSLGTPTTYETTLYRMWWVDDSREGLLYCARRDSRRANSWRPRELFRTVQTANIR